MAENKLLLYKDEPELLIGKWVLKTVGSYMSPIKSLHKIARVTKQHVTLTSGQRYRIDTGKAAQNAKLNYQKRAYGYVDEIQLLTEEEAAATQADWKNRAEHRKLLDELRPRLAIADVSLLKEVIQLLDSKLLPNEETPEIS